MCQHVLRARQCLQIKYTCSLIFTATDQCLVTLGQIQVLRGPARIFEIKNDYLQKQFPLTLKNRLLKDKHGNQVSGLILP